MARRRLSAILVSTVLSVGVLALPAAAQVEAPALPTDTASTLADAVEEATGSLPTEIPTTAPSPVPTETVEDLVSAPPTDDPTGAIEDTVGALTGDADVTPTPGPSTTLERQQQASGDGTQAAPAPRGAATADRRTDGSASRPSFDRSALSRVPSTSPSTAAGVLAPEVAGPEIAAPQVAPAAARSTDVLAAQSALPLGPAVPGALRAATALLVAGAAVTWRRTAASLEA